MIKKTHHHLWALLISKTMQSVTTLMSANIVNALIGFILSIITLRYIDQEILGIVYPLISISMIINQFGDWGTSNSFIKLASTHWNTNRTKALAFFNAALKTKIYLALLVIIICLPFSSLISKWTFGAVKHLDLVQIILIVSALQIISSYATCSLQIEGFFKTLSFVKIFPNILKLLFLSLIVYLGRADLTMVFIGFLIVPIGSLFVSLPFTPIKSILKYQSTENEFKELFNVSRWFALSAIANAFLAQIDILMVNSMMGSHELVRLLAAQRIAGIFPILTASLVTVLLPKVSRMVSKAELNFFYRKTLLITSVFSVILLLFLPLSQWVIPFLLGEKYKMSIDVFNILMIGNILGMIITPLSLILYNLNKEPTFVFLNFLQLVVTVLGNWALIPAYGAYASAIMFIITRLLAYIVIYYQLWKEGILFYKPTP